MKFYCGNRFEARQPGSGLRFLRFCLCPPTIPDQPDLVIPNCKNRRPDPSLGSFGLFTFRSFKPSVASGLRSNDCSLVFHQT